MRVAPEIALSHEGCQLGAADQLQADQRASGAARPLVLIRVDGKQNKEIAVTLGRVQVIPWRERYRQRPARVERHPPCGARPATVDGARLVAFTT
jgi:hypothetical protein